MAVDQVAASQDLSFGSLAVPAEPIPPAVPLDEILERIRNSIFECGVRLRDEFLDFDARRCGRVSKTHFRRVLDKLGVGGLGRLDIGEEEMSTLIRHYTAAGDTNLVCWEPFVEAIDVGMRTSLDRRCCGNVVN